LSRPPQPASNAKPAEAPNPLGLKQVTKRLFVTGEYQDLIAFVKHLETYQRVISLKDLSVAIAASDNTASKNAAAERAQKLKLTKPVMSFLLNVYYLP
jgi:Tfp pilus assembly protein PilO